MAVKMEKIWIDTRFDDRAVIRAYFSNMRHYEVLIENPYDPISTAIALMDLANMIGKERYLLANATPSSAIS